MTVQEAIEKGFTDIKGYEGHYMINEQGDIYSLKRKKLMTPCLNTCGYYQVHLSKNGIMKMHRIHRLVAQTFIPNPYNLPQVNHKDENKLNNNVENLEWCTQTYNMNYNDGQKRRAKSRNYEDISKKRSNAQSKEITQYDYDGSIVAVWKNAYVAEQHGYNRTMINQCCIGNKKSHKGYIWKYTNNMEKQIPKKPNKSGVTDKNGVFHATNGINGVPYDLCPNCATNLCTDGMLGRRKDGYNYCSKCGQKLDWEEGGTSD